MFPKRFYEADGKYPSFTPHLNADVDAFWEQQRFRWFPLIDGDANIRESIVEMNYFANQQCENFRHFELPRYGIIDVTGTGMWEADGELESLRQAIKAAFPQIWVSEKYPAGQGMYGFVIHLVNTTVGYEKQTLKALSLVVNKEQATQRSNIRSR